MIGHQRIHLDWPEFFRKDGVHLSNSGLDVFLEEIKGGLHVELKWLDGGHGILAMLVPIVWEKSYFPVSPTLRSGKLTAHQTSQHCGSCDYSDWGERCDGPFLDQQSSTKDGVY